MTKSTAQKATTDAETESTSAEVKPGKNDKRGA